MQGMVSVESLIQDIVNEIKTVSGVKAIVLGGSRARGTHHASSDIDLGIYYDPSSPLDLPELAKLAAKLDDEHRPNLITATGGWGPWINGGGWLRIGSFPVDFLYRDLDKVNNVIKDCLEGKVEIFYQPGHPNGFVSSIYLGEIAVCQPLWDPEGIITSLKNKISPYPSALQKAIIHKFFWEIDFSIGITQKSIVKADVAYAAGCCFRSVMCMAQVLFALNKEHWLNEKGAVDMVNRFEKKPADFQNRVNQVFSMLSAAPETIHQAVELLKVLNADINHLLKINRLI